MILLVEVEPGLVRVRQTDPFDDSSTNTMDLRTEMSKLAMWFDATLPRHRLPLIQDMFPELSDGEREFLLTGLTPEQFDELMREEE